MDITNIAVSPSYRRSGVAEALLKELERRARLKDVTVFFLEVRQSNEAAKRLYEKLGYSPIGVRKRFYEKPVEDAITLNADTTLLSPLGPTSVNGSFLSELPIVSSRPGSPLIWSAW